MNPDRLAVQIMKKFFNHLRYEDEFSIINNKLRSSQNHLYIYKSTYDICYVTYAKDSKEALEKLFERLHVSEKTQLLFSAHFINNNMINSCKICNQVTFGIVHYYSHDERDIINYLYEHDMNNIFKEKVFI